MNYEQGLERFKEYLKNEKDQGPLYQEFLTYEARLRENLKEEPRHGSNEGTRSRRSEIVSRLNELAKKAGLESFNDLCQPDNTPDPLSPSSAQSAGFEATKTSGPQPATSQPPSTLEQPSVPEPEAKSQPGENILIASLGESPVVVSATYDWLTQEQSIALDRVIILHTSDTEVLRAYEQVQQALPPQRVQAESLGYTDIDSWTCTCNFLIKLYNLLQDAQMQRKIRNGGTARTNRGHPKRAHFVRGADNRTGIPAVYNPFP
jgi:hypothetical protein